MPDYVDELKREYAQRSRAPQTRTRPRDTVAMAMGTRQSGSSFIPAAQDYMQRYRQSVADYYGGGMSPMNRAYATQAFGYARDPALQATAIGRSIARTGTNFEDIPAGAQPGYYRGSTFLGPAYDDRGNRLPRPKGATGFVSGSPQPAAAPGDPSYYVAAQPPPSYLAAEAPSLNLSSPIASYFPSAARSLAPREGDPFTFRPFAERFGRTIGNIQRTIGAAERSYLSYPFRTGYRFFKGLYEQ